MRKRAKINLFLKDKKFKYSISVSEWQSIKISDPTEHFLIFYNFYVKNK